LLAKTPYSPCQGGTNVNTRHSCFRGKLSEDLSIGREFLLLVLVRLCREEAAGVVDDAINARDRSEGNFVEGVDLNGAVAV